MGSLNRHSHEVCKIQEDLIEWINERKGPETQEKITLAYQKHTSNTLRANEYKRKGPRLGIGSLNKVLKLDVDKKIALVEPRLTMEELVDATLPYNLAPAVLPEFKSITVGGAINGAGLESSSHKYGQFNDICNSYEVLLGDGTIITATPQEYTDLFYGMTGAYGTLGIILSVEIQLISVEPWVLLEYKKFRQVSDAINFMDVIHNKNPVPDFLEGIVFQKDESVVIIGNFIKENKIEHSIPKISLKHYWSRWFYQIVHSRSSGHITKEAIPIRDYLFRHDRAAFWMGGYALHPLLLFRYIVEWFGHCPDWLHRRLMKNRSKKKWITRYPSWLFRFLFGWTMDSETLYRLMHQGTEQWFADHFAIQDYYIPKEKASDFIQDILEKYGIVPLWLCPIKAIKSAQILSPHYIKGHESSLLFDVGVYGLPFESHQGKALVLDLDEKAYLLGGKKMFYSHTYFSEEEFWKRYPKKEYEALRVQYFCKDIFLDITQKVLD